MRKPVVILLLLCFILQAGGLWLLLYSRQMSLKKEMKARLRSDPGKFEQTIFEFDLKDGNPIAQSFEWEDDGDEFRYNGSIFDVIEKRITGNVLWVRCIDDKKEGDIIRQINDLQKNNPSRDEAGRMMVQQWLSTVLFNEQHQAEYVNIVMPLQHSEHYLQTLRAIILDIKAPPPRNAA